MKKVAIFSGIEPGKKGAGKFIKFFVEQCEKHHIQIDLNYIHTPQNRLVKVLKKTPVFKLVKNLYYIIYRFIKPVKTIYGDTVVIFHPQSLGLKYTKDIVLNGSDVFIYALDSFFFCLKSYNHLPNTNTDCSLCLVNTNAAKENKCKSFPNRATYEEYYEFIELISKNFEKITFLAQNNSQMGLIRDKFGDNAKIILVGMFTGEFSPNYSIKPSGISNRFDVVYHNTLVEAKGIKYFVDLSEKMRSRSFLIPYSKTEVEKVLNRKLNNSNLIFIPCNWETGLREIIMESRVTVVPSLWSSPVEGSLIKSLFFSKNVAVVKNKSSFASELPDRICVKLTQSIIESSEILEKHLVGESILNDASRKWVLNFSEESTNRISSFINQNLR